MKILLRRESQGQAEQEPRYQLKRGRERRASLVVEW